MSGRFRSLASQSDEVLGRALELAAEFQGRENELPVRLTADGNQLPPDLCLGTGGRDLDTVMAALRRVLLETPSPASRRFLNQLFGGRDPVATAAEMLAVVSNTSMYTFKVAGPQILIEQEVLARMAGRVGFSEGEGMFNPGGSMSNLTAMILARQHALPEVRDHGFDGARPTVYTSEHGHYSISKNAGILGIGRSHVRQIATDGRGRLRIDALEAALVEDLASGHAPVMINATAGTTVLGAFDPIRPMAEVAHEHGIWLHVDGALGGSVAMSSTHRALIDGSELADSFTWNPHKMLGVPLACSAVLVRERGRLWASLNEQAGYLFQADGDELNPGTRSIQCGRRNDALKLWAAWLYHGDDGYEARLDQQMSLAQRAAELVERDPELELCLQPELINVCFRTRAASAPEVCAWLDRHSRLKIGHGEVAGTPAIRLVCVNPDLHVDDLEWILDEIKQAARALLREG